MRAILAVVFLLAWLTESRGVDDLELSPGSIFTQGLQAREDKETVAAIVYAVRALESGQTRDNIELFLKANAPKNLLFRVEAPEGPVEAIRFRSAAGRWYRAGRQALGRSDGDLGFLIAARTEQIGNFWLEAFESAVPVEIIVPGIALGTVVKIEGIEDFENYVPRDLDGVDVESEKEKLERVQSSVLARFDRDLDAAPNDEQYGILIAERAMAEDLVRNALGMISDKISAREAVMRLASRHVKHFNRLADENFRRLATEVIHIGQRLVDEIDGVNPLAILDEKIGRLNQNGQRAILVGKILPFHFTLRNRRAIAAIVADDEQPGSHNTILAKGARIPFAKNAAAVTSLEQELREGDTVALEMETSHRNPSRRIVLEPDPALRSRLLRKTLWRKKYQLSVASLKSKTRDNVPVKLHINTAIHETLPWEKGEFTHLGLVRSDFTYTQTDREPSLADLTREYEQFFERAARAGVKEIHFRSFDLDLEDEAKRPPYFKNEEHREGIDFSLNDPEGKEAFDRQIRAIFLGIGKQLEKGRSLRLNLLFPKVRSLEEYRRAAERVHDLYRELAAQNNIFEQLPLKLGIMVETKEALERVEEFVGEVDFINVGTNDLTYSLFRDQVSRSSDKKAAIGDYSHRILAPLTRIVKAAASHPNVLRRPPVCVCGEMASHIEYGSFLLGLAYPGLSLSMPYEQVLDSKVNIAAHEYDEMQAYSQELLTLVEQAEHLDGPEKEAAYENIRKVLDEKRSQFEQNTVEYLTYDWASLALSLDRLVETLSRVADSVSEIGRSVTQTDVQIQKRQVAMTLLEQGILTPQLMEKVVERNWDLEEILAITEVWAYRKLIDQGTFFVYRSRQIGENYWIRVVPTGDEFRWRSRYDRRIVKRDDGIWVKAGPDFFIPARSITLAGEPEAEAYAYEEGGLTHTARIINVRGVPYTYIQAGSEKAHVINLFARKGKSNYYERLYPDVAGKTQIIHIQDWTKHPAFQDLPYETSSLNRSMLLFLLNDDADGEMMWGQNMARPGYGHLFEDNARILEIMIDQFKLVDATIRRGRDEMRRIKALLETTRLLKEETARRKQLEILLQKAGIAPEVIANPGLFDQAA